MNDSEALQESISDEINLGEYLGILLHWWRLIVLCILAGVAIAFLVGILLPKSYDANANVVIVRTATTVNFDPKIRTVSNTDPTSSVDQAALRKSLTSIANSDEMAETVFKTLAGKIDPDITNGSSLHNSVRVTNDGDLIQIQAHSASPSEAALIANTWAKEYVNRANTVYSDNLVSLDIVLEQLQSARNDYDAAEGTLVTYLRDSQIDKLQQELAEKRQILSNLLTGREIAVRTVISETQQAQTELLLDYLDARKRTRSTVFTEQVSARVQKLQDLFALRLKLERLLSNARALHARLAESPNALESGSELAVTLLESSAYTTWADLPVSLQVPLDSPDSGRTAAEQQQALSSLIGALEKQQQDVLTQIEAVSQDLVQDTEYRYLDSGGPETSSPVNNAIQNQIQALLNLQGFEGIATFKSSDLAVNAAIDQLRQDINALKAQVEIENAKQQDLISARDLAWTIYTTLSNKVAETQVAEQTKGSIVRVATSAVVPTQPSSGRQAFFVLGSLGGLLVGIGLALVLEYRRGGLPAQKVTAD